MVGRIFNKRRNKVGILVNKRRDVNLLDWYYNLDGDKTNFSFKDQFNVFNATNQTGQYQPTKYQLKTPIKKERIN